MKLQLQIDNISPATEENTGEKAFLVSFSHLVLDKEQLKELIGKAPTLEPLVEVE